MKGADGTSRASVDQSDRNMPEQRALESATNCVPAGFFAVVFGRSAGAGCGPAARE